MSSFYRSLHHPLLRVFKALSNKVDGLEKKYDFPGCNNIFKLKKMKNKNMTFHDVIISLNLMLCDWVFLQPGLFRIKLLQLRLS